MIAGASPFNSVERVRVVDQVVESLQRLMLDQRLRPGEALPPERDLAHQLAVSRSLLREALGILAQRGLVVSRQGSGTFVAAPTSANAVLSLRLLWEFERVALADLCDARRLIEPELAALAATWITEELSGRLRADYERLIETAGDPDAHVLADLQFHRTIAVASGHGVLQAMMEAVREPIARGMQVGTHVPDAVHVSDAHHKRLLGAITEHDADGARAIMIEHLDFVREYLVDNDLSEIPWRDE